MILASLAAVTALSLPAPRAGWFVCDGIDRPVAWLIGRPDQTGVATITRIDKPSSRARTVSYVVGRGDPGAGSIYYALSRGGREVGHVRAVNPGMALHPEAATTPLFTSVTLESVSTECRWLENTVLNGVTKRRGVTITRERGRLVYRTFDFARPTAIVRPDGVQRSTRPSLEIAGGTERRSSDGRRDWRFARDGWLYIVSARADGTDARLTLVRGGRVVQQERFLGATLAG